MDSPPQYNPVEEAILKTLQRSVPGDGHTSLQYNPVEEAIILALQKSTNQNAAKGHLLHTYASITEVMLDSRISSGPPFHTQIGYQFGLSLVAVFLALIQLFVYSVTGLSFSTTVQEDNDGLWLWQLVIGLSALVAFCCTLLALLGSLLSMKNIWQTETDIHSLLHEKYLLDSLLLHQLTTATVPTILPKNLVNSHDPGTTPVQLSKSEEHALVLRNNQKLQHVPSITTTSPYSKADPRMEALAGKADTLFIKLEAHQHNVTQNSGTHSLTLGLICIAIITFLAALLLDMIKLETEKVQVSLLLGTIVTLCWLVSHYTGGTRSSIQNLTAGTHSNEHNIWASHSKQISVLAPGKIMIEGMEVPEALRYASLLAGRATEYERISLPDKALQDYQEAVRLYRLLLAQDQCVSGLLIESLFSLSKAFATRNCLQDALAAVHEALALSYRYKDVPEIHARQHKYLNHLAEILQHGQQYSDAVKVYQELIISDPSSPIAREAKTKMVFVMTKIARELYEAEHFAGALQIDQDTLKTTYELLATGNLDASQLAEALTNVASDLRALNRLQEAHDMDAKALDTLRGHIQQNPDSESALIAKLQNFSLDLQLLQHFKESLEVDTEILVLCRKHLGRQSELSENLATTLVRSAASHRKLLQFNQAKECSEQAVSLLRPIKSEHQILLAHLLYSLAQDYMALGKPINAVPLFEESLRIYTDMAQDTVPSSKEKVLVLQGLGKAYHMVAQYDKAIGAFLRIKKMGVPRLGTSTESTKTLAWTNYNLGIGYRMQEQEDAAMASMQEAIFQFRVLRQTTTAKDSGISLAQALSQFSAISAHWDRLPTAVALAEEALLLFRELHASKGDDDQENFVQYGKTLQTYGQALYLSGQYVEALEAYQEAIQVLDVVKSAPKEDIASVKLSISFVLLGLHFTELVNLEDINNLDKAEVISQEAVEIFRNVEEHWGLMTGLNLLLSILLLKNPESDIADMQREFEDLQFKLSQKNVSLTADILIASGRSYAAIGLFEQASTAYKAVLNLDRVPKARAVRAVAALRATCELMIQRGENIKAQALGEYLDSFWGGLTHLALVEAALQEQATSEADEVSTGDNDAWVPKKLIADPARQVQAWATWQPSHSMAPTPPSREPTLMVPEQEPMGLFGPRTPPSLYSKQKNDTASAISKKDSQAQADARKIKDGQRWASSQPRSWADWQPDPALAPTPEPARSAPSGLFGPRSPRLDWDNQGWGWGKERKIEAESNSWGAWQREAWPASAPSPPSQDSAGSAPGGMLASPGSPHLSMAVPASPPRYGLATPPRSMPSSSWNTWKTTKEDN
uniref:TPR repeat family protein n=1 Tax=Mycena chlorophos TaxID=658473 RepID=A0ABQ0LB91_MYCCL|nr:TPR repeat family protein [Mycena chlorophos]